MPYRCTMHMTSSHISKRAYANNFRNSRASSFTHPRKTHPRKTHPRKTLQRKTLQRKRCKTESIRFKLKRNGRPSASCAYRKQDETRSLCTVERSKRAPVSSVQI